MNNVQKLLAGTANLNRMRQDLKDVVHTVITLMEHPNDRLISHQFENPNGACWHFMSNPDSTVWKFYAYCTVENQGAWAPGNFPSNMESMGIEGVKIAHKSLTSLLDGMISEYPDLERKLKPILEASEV